MCDRVDRGADQVEPDATERETEADAPAEPPGGEADRYRVEEGDSDLRRRADRDPQNEDRQRAYAAPGEASCSGRPQKGRV
jgi:hypothetical protein